MIKQIITEGLNPIKIWTNDIEENAINKLKRVADLPFIYKHLAVMPDVHAGKESTVGLVLATKGAVIPSAVGVDIGCGMMAVKIQLNADQISGDAILKKLRHNIEQSIPVGSAMHPNVHNRVSGFFTNERLGKLHVIGKNSQTIDRAIHQMGTLGGGNHFIEICIDNEQSVWVMLHSGSRYIGKVVADKHINKAKKIMENSFIYLDDPDLAYFTQNTPEFQAYIDDMKWCQDYAYQNRIEMMHRILWEISKTFYNGEIYPNNLIKFKVNCHHNYTQEEEHFENKVWITRKGAVSARKDEFGIIPGSMATNSYIVRGLGNVESFYSCSHGSGRRFSRSKAKEMYNQIDVLEQTNGIECRKDAGIIDELPAAYKDIEQVMQNQSDLVEIIYTLKQVICIKG